MDQINNRQQLAHQYFQIRIALNQANRLRDDKTDLEFELRSIKINNLKNILHK